MFRNFFARSNPGEYDDWISSEITEFPFRNVRLRTSSELREFLLESVPVMVLTSMIGCGAVKVCSGISPDFAEVAASRGFAAFVMRKPGHVVNVIATSDVGLVEVDLSQIQFEYDVYTDDEYAETRRLLKKAAADPFKAIRVKVLGKIVNSNLERAVGESMYTKFWSPISRYDRGAKEAASVRAKTRKKHPLWEDLMEVFLTETKADPSELRGL